MVKGLFDACLNGEGDYEGSAWFFRGPDYIRVRLADMTVEQGAKPIVGNWGQFNTWPGSFAEGIDTVLAGQGAYLGKAWFFKGSQYIRYDLTSDRAEPEPRNIVGNWGQFNTWPGSYASGVDAVLAGRGPYAGKAWFFKGNTYILYDLASDRAETPPMLIDSVVWAGGAWPAQTFVGGVDFAFYSAGGTAIVVRGGMAIECDLPTNTIIDGPFWFEDRWPDVVGAFYQSDVRWGVDSINLATFPVHGGSLYDFVVTKCGMQPSFWGRYLDGSLTTAEVNYLHARNVRVLPIARTTGPQRVQGNRANGRDAANVAIGQANALMMPEGAAIFLNIEPGWLPSSEFILGWWEVFEPSQYYEGIYANTASVNPFCRTYPPAYAARGLQVPPMTASTLLWSQQPQANIGGSEAQARQVRAVRFAPAITADTFGAQVNTDCHAFWQLRINCLRDPPPNGQGLIDHNLATTQFFNWLW